MVVKVLCIGVGNRGLSYSHYALTQSNCMQIVGIADPNPIRAKIAKEKFKLAESQVFSDWRDFIEREKFADAVIICTQDKDHKEPAVACAKKGYHILLEKPMATTEEDCREIVSTCKDNGVLLAVCHVLKYTPEATKIKELIDSGAIGEVVNIQHLEPVGYWHFGHSFVRGNWGVEADSSCSLLAKSCHDLDLISYWMGSSKCVAVSSFGHLAHFNKESKPKGAGERCLDCSIEKTCPYSAKSLYLDGVRGVKQGNTGWPLSHLTETVDIENVIEALKTGPYGRCVYDCNNDVVSTQVVNMQFDKGQTASFSMVAFTESVCKREIKIHGTMRNKGRNGSIEINNFLGPKPYYDHGEITCNFGEPVYHYDFRTKEKKVYKSNDKKLPAGLHGHGGADYITIQTFINAVERNDRSLISTGGDESLRSHLLVFAAEKARKENRVVPLSL